MWNELRPNILRHYSEHCFNCLSYLTYRQQHEVNFVVSLRVLYSVRGRKQNNIYEYIYLYKPYYIRPDMCASRAMRLKARMANIGVVDLAPLITETWVYHQLLSAYSGSQTIMGASATQILYL